MSRTDCDGQIRSVERTLFLQELQELCWMIVLWDYKPVQRSAI